MMKNILDIYIYPRNTKAPTSLTKRRAILNSVFTPLHTFQKVQRIPLIFSEGTR